VLARDLAATAPTIDESWTGAAVLDLCAAHPAIPSFAVLEDQGKVVGLIERERLYSQFSQPLWLDVYNRRPIAPLVTREAMVVDGTMPIEGVKELIAYRYPQAISSGFAIVEHDRYLGIGTVTALLEKTVDLAHRRAIELEEAHRKAEIASEAKSRFLATMSHELRTPLNAIIGYTELLLMGVPAPIPDSGRQQVERVRNASHHLLHLIDEVLAFSRLEMGREELRAGSAQLSAVVTEAASVVAPLAVERRLELRIEAPPEPILLETDVGKVRHILLNLLSNAIKFTDHGEIVLTARVENGDVRFDVRDTGIGIPPQHHERIFDPFWQVENKASRRVAGTGIGLSVARRLARLLGGDITVISGPGEGSTFIARIPRKMGEGPAAEPATRALTNPNGAFTDS
jgi:signal transduction histidine kinase